MLLFFIKPHHHHHYTTIIYPTRAFLPPSQLISSQFLHHSYKHVYMKHMYCTQTIRKKRKHSSKSNSISKHYTHICLFIYFIHKTVCTLLACCVYILYVQIKIYNERIYYAPYNNKVLMFINV